MHPRQFLPLGTVTENKPVQYKKNASANILSYAEAFFFQKKHAVKIYYLSNHKWSIRAVNTSLLPILYL